MLNSLSLWLSAGIVLSAGTLATANPLIWSILSQNTDSPPDIIIDDSGNKPTTSNPPSGDTRFTCEVYQGQYTVMYYPQSQPGQAYPWAIPSRMGGGWTPEKRCEAISNRLETYRPDGLLELRTGKENGYDTLCATTVDVPGCRIVLTVPQGQSPEVVRDKVFDNLITADSGESVQGVNTFTNTGNGINLGNLGDLLNLNRSSTGINLRQFLDPADRGTGTKLLNSPSSQPSSQPTRQLDPDRFR